MSAMLERGEMDIKEKRNVTMEASFVKPLSEKNVRNNSKKNTWTENVVGGE
jgi:hypothetical protein